MMPIFYFLAAIIWLIAFYGEGPTNPIILASTTLLVFAVAALDQRIRFVAEKIQNPELDLKEHIKKEWWDLSKWIGSWIGLILIGTFGLSSISCVASDEGWSVTCVVTRMVEYWFK